MNSVDYEQDAYEEEGGPIPASSVNMFSEALKEVIGAVNFNTSKHQFTTGWHDEAIEESLVAARVKYEEALADDYMDADNIKLEPIVTEEVQVKEETNECEAEARPKQVSVSLPYYECATCSRKFTRKEYLVKHLKVHTGEKPYQCPTCGSKFSHNHHLKRHLRTHTGEKPYQCQTCNSRFSHKLLLELHIRTHTGEMPYQCAKCNCRFSNRGTLKNHISFGKRCRIHTGEKPHKCAVCFVFI